MTEKTVKKRVLDVTSFASATKIVIAVNSVTGLRPLRYSDTTFWIFLNYSYRMIMVATISYMMYWIYMYRLLQILIKLDRVVYLALRIVSYLCFMCILVLGCYHSDEIPDLRRRVVDLEASLTKLGAAVDNRKILLWILGSYSVTTLQVFIFFFYCKYCSWPVPFILYQLFFSYIANIGSQVLLDFLTYACWLKFSFEQTNDLLRKFLVEGRQIKTGDLGSETSDRINVQKYLNKWMPDRSHRRTRVAPLNKIPSVKHELQAVKKVHMLQEIRFVHLHLCRIVKKMNRAFDAQIMIYSFVIVLNIVSILYYLYSQLRSFTGDMSELRATFALVLDIVYTSAKIVVTCYVCEGAVKEMKKVAEIIHECSISDFDVELNDEIMQFSLQLSLNQVCDINSDFFRLNFNFIRQCISSITTYLVIIIQWAQSIKPENLLGSKTTQSFQAQFNSTKSELL